MCVYIYIRTYVTYIQHKQTYMAVVRHPIRKERHFSKYIRITYIHVYMCVYIYVHMSLTYNTNKHIWQLLDILSGKSDISQTMASLMSIDAGVFD